MGGVGGYRHTRKGLFTEFANQLPKLDPNNPAHTGDLRHRQGITPDIMLGAMSLTSPRMFLKCSEAALLPT